MSGLTYEYTSGHTEPKSTTGGYSNESTILVKNQATQEGTVMGAVYSGTPQIDGTFAPSPSYVGLITAQTYDISLVFQSPSPITKIYNKTFNDCPGLTFVTLPPSIKYIDAVAFALPSSPPVGQGLSTVTFTDIASSKLYSIGTQAFVNQSNLSSITLPASVHTIGQYAFKKTGLTTLTFDDIDNSQLYEILIAAFQYTNLTSVILPAELQIIYDSAFEQSSLTDVSFNNIALSRLETIGAEAFRDTNIVTITIPNSIKTIDGTAFKGITGMTVNINSKVANTLGITGPFPKSNASFFGATNVTINSDENTFEYTPGISDPSTEYTDELTILVNNSPGKIIPANAFDGLITVPSAAPAALVFANGSTTQSIGDDAFKDCTGLKHATIPDSITAIGTNAFTGSGLQRVYISRKTADALGVTFSDTTFFGATGVTIVEYPVPVVTKSTDIIFPYPKNEKNKRLLGVNQKISSGLARPNFKFQTNQFSAGRSRTAQTKQQANGPVTVIFPIR